MNVLVQWFRTPGVPEALGFLVSVCALGVSIWAICSSWKANKKATEAQIRLLQIEEQREAERLAERRRAVLRAEIRRTDKGGYRLYIKNWGQAEAHDIIVLLDDKQLEDHCAVASRERLPDVIGPGSEVSWPMALGYGCHPPFKIEITWQDGSGMSGRYQSTLTL